MDARRNDERAANAYARGLWVRETLAEALQSAAQKTPKRVLLIDGNRRIDCQTLHEEATALAHAMLARAPTGSVISFMLPNWHEAAVIYLAATLAGMAVNPILPSLRERELQFILKDVNSRLIFVPAMFRQQACAAMLSRVTAQLESPPDVVVLRGDASGHIPYVSMLRAGERRAEFPARDSDSVRMVLYTSGTTGRPKGVLHSHNSLHALICQIRDHWLVEPGDKFLVASPIGHIGGSIYAFEAPLLLGTTAVLMERWDADEAVNTIESEGCTHMAGATPFLEQILAAARRVDTRLPSLKVFICGGASVPPSLIRNATSYFARAVVTRVYGSTEVPVTTVGVTDRNDAAHAADTDGRAGLTAIKLVNREIYARGPQMLIGYLHPEDERDAFDAEGFFKTGDLGGWRDETYLVVTGRAKDIIIRNGENISPKEIEDILVGHPEIAEVAIVGVPDARTGERACAVIVPKGQLAPDVESLRSFLDARRVAKFKFPEQVVIWDALPKNDAGKVLKHLIRAKLTSFRLQARTWLEANVPHEPSPEDGPASREYVLTWQRRQAQGGWAGIAWPQEVGGRGLSTLEQIIWFEEYARARAPSPLNASFVGLNHAGPTLISCGTPEQKAFHLPKILAGEVIWCQGFSEPGAGSDLASLRTRGRVEGDELVIDGHKIWSSFADIADWQELLVRTDPNAKTSAALTWVICPMNAHGITVRPIRTMAGPRKYCEVFYDSVRVPLSNVVGGLNHGWATAMSTLSFERGTAGLALLIALTIKVEELLAACPDERADMRLRLARLRAEGQSIRAMTYRFALDCENAVPDAGGSMIRLSFAEFSQRVTAAAIDLYGIDAPEVVGMHGWSHDYLDAFSETIAGGTAEIQRNIIAERVLGLPKGPR